MKKNAGVIIIAIITVVGTITAAAIGAIGDYNTEKLRQETELSRIALASILEQTAEAKSTTIALSSIPSNTPTPTNTQEPTRTSTPTPLPILSFQNFEQDNGTPANFFLNAWHMPCDFDASEVHEGSRAIHCQAQAQKKLGGNNSGGTVQINPASNIPIDLSSASSLSVWVYDVQGDNNVQLVIWDSGSRRSRELSSDMFTNGKEWTKITWELVYFNDVDHPVNLSRIKYIEIYMLDDGEYYFDDISYQ